MSDTIELMDCERVLLDAIGDRKATRDTVASAYWMSLRSSYGRTVDWSKVNHAILARWSRAALEYIKTKAWKD
jgi:hypothetical protein